MYNLTFSADKRNKDVSTTATPATAPVLAIYLGRECIGFIRQRGGLFEALDLDRRSIGLFASRSAAADAIEEARR
jgi:hypothetical protein